MNQEQRDAAQRANEDPGWRQKQAHEDGLRFCVQSGSGVGSDEPKAPHPIEDANRLLNDLRSGAATVRRDGPEYGSSTHWGTEAVRTAAEELAPMEAVRRLAWHLAMRDVLSLPDDPTDEAIAAKQNEWQRGALAAAAIFGPAPSGCSGLGENAQTHDNDDEDGE